jgi:hypothetical protein
LRIRGDDAVVSFSGETGNQYDLEYAHKVTGGGWSPVTTNVPDTNGPTEITDTNGAGFSQRFYRVKSAL